MTELRGMKSSNRKKILQVFNRYVDRGGEEAVFERISSTLSGPYEVEECIYSSADWQAVNAPPKWQQPFLAWRNPTSLSVFKKRLDAFRPDVLVFHNVFPVGSAALYDEARKNHLPVIQFIHNFRPFSVNGYLWANDHLEAAGLKKNFFPEIFAGAWQGSRVKTALYAAILQAQHLRGDFKRVAAWIAISDFMRKKFIAAGVPEKKIQTLLHSWELMNAADSRFDDQGYFLYLGRLISPKGIRVLFDAWRIIEQQLGSLTPQLVIAGNGPLQSEVETASTASKFISFRGHVDGKTKESLIAGCRAMLAPSLWWEPLGLVTYEAYDFAKPMLAAASGGLIETVLHGTTGFLHKPGNARQLAEQVIQLTRNPVQAVQMGASGRAWLLENTRSDQWLEKFDRVLTQVI
ncbi:MAG: glycosyltransferase family 4 protein [Phycisphaerae bacterium]|jgi:glycosyltransferase involved in cell wall biosynthesis